MLKRYFLINLGVNNMTVTVNFVLSANIVQDATDGVLLGEFNNWNKDTAIKLKKENDGSLNATLELEAGATYQYRYLLSDGRWVNDDQVDKRHAEDYQIENCVIRVPRETAVLKVETKAKTAEKKKDDLTKIDGVGKKIAELLVTANIDTFSALSNTTEKTLQTILNAAGSRFKFYNPSLWASQAKLAADNKWDTLKELNQNSKNKRQNKQ
ncbi:MAG: glycoside hydrolase family 13 [Methylococcaceae bacterium]|nr:glycoside hydrolase family 13 [Methylococcaceae bacterium]